MTKEKPIIFSGPMVRALLAGRKTQTRRVVKDIPPDCEAIIPRKGVPGCFYVDCRISECGDILCPHPVGTRLWVREITGIRPDIPAVEYRASHQEPADVPFGHIYDEKTMWKSPIHMARRHARIILDVTDVRVQRVQDISEHDAIAEGVEACHVSESEISDLLISDVPPHVKELARALGPGCFTAKFEYGCLWDRINAKRGVGWAVNPWVWAYTFRVVRP